MRAVLRTIGGVHATQGNNAVPIPVSSNPEWNEVRHKPFNTISSTDFVVDNGELQLSTIPITDMDWDDIDNKPFESIGSGLTVSEGVLSANGGGGSVVSITNTLSSGTAIGDLEIDGITTTLYAPSGGGGSVSIDNKSLVEVNGVIQEAVPVYSANELIPAKIATGLYLTSFTYPAGIDLDAYFYAPNGFSLITNQSKPVYRVCLKLTDDTVLDGTWEATSSDSYEYGGWGNWVVDGSGYELYISNEGDGNYRLHIYMNGNYINNGNVDALVLYQTEEVSGYDDLETICSANNLTYSSIEISPAHTEMVYHKLPRDYNEASIINYANTSDGYNFQNSLAYINEDNEVCMVGIEGGENIWTNVELDPTRIKINALIPKDKFGGIYDIGGSMTAWTVSSAETINNKTVFHMQASDIYWIIDNYGQGEYPIGNTYCLMPNGDSSLVIYGSIVVGDVYNDPTDLHIKGWESVLESITYDTDHWDLTWREEISPRGDINVYTGGNDGKQNINAFFIPVDNSTIKVDADGNLATAIPAPPAANGTYTLQAVVNGSTITYSWI